MRPSTSVVLIVLTALVSATARSQSKPVVTTVGNVASYSAGSISPGEMVVIFGTGMGPAQLASLQLDAQGRISNSVSQVQVLFDGSPAPLIYVSATQISAMVPYGVAGKSSTQIQVMYQGAASNLVQKSVATSAPGIFTANSSGQGQAAIANADGSYNTPANPAMPGSVITLYLTGDGQTSPLGLDGNIATSTADVSLSVTVLIAGRMAQLLYAGSAPGNVNGFCQINAIIPADLQYGGNLPLLVQIGGVSSQSGVTVVVSGPRAPIPGAPQNSIASVNSSGQIVLTWMAADSLATRFHIERQIATSGFTEVAVIQTTGTTFTDQNVTPGTTYQYRIRAEDDFGFSPYSVVVNATVPGQLMPPSNLQAVAVSQSQINLTWNAGNTNAAQFHIERRIGSAAYAEIAAVAATAVSYQDIALQANTTFTYRIRSQEPSGFSAYSSEVSATTPGLPLPPPPSLQGSASSSSQVHLAWTSTASGVVRFRIERRTSTGTYSEIGQPSSTATSFDDSGLAASTAYLYRMRVETAAGLSAYSNEVSVTTLQSVLAAPTNLQATAISSSQINLTWNAGNTNAAQFHIERRIGSAAYAEIAAVAATAVSYQDIALQANTTLTYRIRSQGPSGFSAYSSEVSATTPGLPLPPLPSLQGSASSSSQVHLAWTSTASGVVRFRIERRTSTGTYSEIGQPSSTATSFDDSGLAASTAYLYRMRVETAAGLSAYSNEVSVTTLQSVLAAPTNLQVTAISSSQINLTWENNAVNATAIRVESQTAGSAFTDIGAAKTLTSTGIANLQPNTSYTFRVRAQNTAGYSGYSNVATTTTLSIPKTVFLIHGLGQGSADMQGLFGSLTEGSGIDPARFRVDAGFDFSECANTDFCSPNCSIAAGAQKLAQYVANANPPGDIVLVGFSMGGLIARDMMTNNRLNLNGRKVAALVTLGTPNLGYPYTLIDTALFCTPLVQEMDGNWRSQQATNNVVLSPYLLSLTNQWPSVSYPASAGLWLAASGRSCSNAVRTVNTTTGCRDRNPFSDGVVCDDSATYAISTATGTSPNRYWQDPGQIYVHTNSGWGVGSSFVLCGNSGNPTVNPPLSNPPTFGPLFAAIKGLINGL